MKKNNKKIKVLCAMSGGVDSAVTAMLLVQAGYDVTGAFMVNYDSPDEETGIKCWTNDYLDALRIAASLGINFVKLNFVKEYKKNVLNYLFREYKLGKTPNPDVLCNKFIKFGVWLEYAKNAGFDYLATGHYAKIIKTKKNNKTIFKLKQSLDLEKDQTYFLHQLNQSQLKKIIFPLGDYKKETVKNLARKNNFSIADKPESMGICLVGDVKINKFLEKNIKNNPGKVYWSDGKIAGEHQGLFYYTIGQRFGLANKKNTSTKTKPVFVLKKNKTKNELIIGYNNDPLLYSKKINIKNINWINGQPEKLPLKCQIRLRHRHFLVSAVLKKSIKENHLIIELDQEERAVASGQFVVFYKNNFCLGGGEII